MAREFVHKEFNSFFEAASDFILKKIHGTLFFRIIDVPSTCEQTREIPYIYPLIKSTTFSEYHGPSITRKHDVATRINF